MTLKKFDLAKNLGLKINSQMKAAGVPNRFGAGATPVLDKREQRKRDAAAGLVPFACKLPSTLVKQLHERAPQHPGSLNGLVAELIERALHAGEGAPPATTGTTEKAAPPAAEKAPKAAAKSPKAQATGEAETPAPAKKAAKAAKAPQADTPAKSAKAPKKA